MPIICKKCGKLFLGPSCTLCTLQKDLTKAIFAGLLQGFTEFFGVDQRCNKCGITWNEISQTGRLGCANDYAVFKEQLKVFLRKYHGSDKHML